MCSQDGKGLQTGDNLPQFRSLALVAVGSTLEFDQIDAASVVRSAIAQACQALGVIRATSRLYRTPAFPPGAGADFVNAAAAIDTDREPADCLTRLHAIERDFGRVRTERWGPRSLDLDLIALGDQVRPDRETQQGWMKLPPEAQRREAPRELVLPHPRVQDRAFVLVPLAEVAPQWRHPVTGRTVLQMLEALPDGAVAEVKCL